MSETLSLAEKSARQLTKAEMGITEGLPLEIADGGPDEVRRGVQMLMDMEAIRQLKHAYFRCLDTANFEELADLLHDTGYLVAEHRRQPRGVGALDEVQVGVADPRRYHSHERLPVGRLVDLQILEGERCSHLI